MQNLSEKEHEIRKISGTLSLKTLVPLLFYSALNIHWLNSVSSHAELSWPMSIEASVRKHYQANNFQPKCVNLWLGPQMINGFFPSSW